MEKHTVDSDDSARVSVDGSSDIKQRIKLEEARRAAADAEFRRDKWRQKHQRAEERRDFTRRVVRDKKSRGGLLRLLLLCAAVLVAIAGVIVPLLGRKPETHYFATSTLEEIVKTSKLSTIDHVYKGIAQKNPESFLVFQYDSGYRAKYTSHVKMSLDLSQVKFSDKGSHIIVYLPEPTMDDPIIDPDSLSFIPEGYNGDLQEILELCEQDAKNELLADASIKEMATESAKRTVRALIEPLIDKGHTIEFKPLSEYAEEAPDGQPS